MLLIVAQSEIRGVSESLAPEYFVYTVLHHFSRRTTFGKMPFRRIRTYFRISGFSDLGISEIQICAFRDCLSKNHVIWSEMGPYGSVGAHIKTGRSPLAQDHFQTPPDPQKGYKNPKMIPKQEPV